MFWKMPVSKSTVGLDEFSGGLTFPLLVTDGHCKSCISALTLWHLHLQEVHGFSCSLGEIQVLPCSLCLQDSYLLGSELGPWLLGSFLKQLPDGNCIQFLQASWFWAPDSRVITAYSYSLNQPNPELGFLPSSSKCLSKWSQVFFF